VVVPLAGRVDLLGGVFLVPRTLVVVLWVFHVEMHMSSRQPPRDATDDEYWAQPSSKDEIDDRGAVLLPVDLKMWLDKVNAVDTVAGTAFVTIMTTMYWTDKRLVGWPESATLPAKLWGPTLGIKNALGDMQEKSVTFVLVDPETGRLKRTHIYTGSVDNPMDLRSFPFDMDTIEVKFVTLSNWLTLDGERYGTLPKGKSYQLRQVQESGEGHWLNFRWSGQINEWALHGVSTVIKELPPDATGNEFTAVNVNFHVTRKSAYYFWKALLPLYLLTILSMSTFHFATDNLDSRVATVSTYFLAAFAMLYVVGATLPKTDFLTKIDVVIVLSTCSLAFTGVVSLGLAKLHEESGADLAKDWNLRVEILLVSLYVLTNLWIFLPPCLNQKRAARQLAGYSRQRLRSGDDDRIDSGSDALDLGLPPTVDPDCNYFALQYLLDLQDGEEMGKEAPPHPNPI
jgi:hypothetical protein